MVASNSLNQCFWPPEHCGVSEHSISESSGLMEQPACVRVLTLKCYPRRISEPNWRRYIYRHEVFSLSMVKKWHKYFARGRTNLENDSSFGKTFTKRYLRVCARNDSLSHANEYARSFTSRRQLTWASDTKILALEGDISGRFRIQ